MQVYEAEIHLAQSQSCAAFKETPNRNAYPIEAILKYLRAEQRQKWKDIKKEGYIKQESFI